MKLVGNSLNGLYPSDLIEMVRANKADLAQIDLAVAYVSKMDEIFDLAEEVEVPLRVFALADGKFPNVETARKLVEYKRLSWQLFLTRDFYHPKVLWFRGVGAYIGSANLSDRAWVQNRECGIWFDQEELEKSGFGIELQGIFSVIQSGCTTAGLEEIKALEELAKRRAEAGLDLRNKKFEADCSELLNFIKGKKSPVDITKIDSEGGAAKIAFISEWNESLTLLRKLSGQFQARRADWPKWVNSSTHPSIVQDQATEWWWNDLFRGSGESLQLMKRKHEENSEDRDKAVGELIEAWLNIDGVDPESNWLVFINENPYKLREMLSEESIPSMSVQTLGDVLYRCHASKAHARQIKKTEFGLGPKDVKSERECSDLLAHLLWSKVTKNGKGIREVLAYVIWGDKDGKVESRDCASRIWNASRDENWHLPHLGANILGELIGYARPDEYPPRNNRVSKTLFALGYEGISFS